MQSEMQAGSLHPKMKEFGGLRCALSPPIIPLTLTLFQRARGRTAHHTLYKISFAKHLFCASDIFFRIHAESMKYAIARLGFYRPQAVAVLQHPQLFQRFDPFERRRRQRGELK